MSGYSNDPITRTTKGNRRFRGILANEKGGAPAGNRPPLWPLLDERNDSDKY